MQFFPNPDQFFRHRTVSHFNVLFFLLDQVINSVKSDPSVVTDDPSSPVSVRKSGQKSRVSGNLCPFRISVEYAFVVRLAEFMEPSLNFRVHFISVLLQRGFGHADSSVKIDNPLQRLVGLKSYDHFVFLINVSRSEVIDAGYHFRFYIINTIFKFFQQQLSAPSPHLFRTLCRTFQKAVVSRIRGYVFLNKISYINDMSPVSAVKSFPFFPHFLPPYAVQL